MEILVSVSKNRKCAASIDFISIPSQSVELSFGDSDTPGNVIVEFTIAQLKELVKISAEALQDLITETEKLRKQEEAWEKKKAKMTEAEKRRHYGSC